MRRRYAQQRAGLTRLPPNTYEATGVKRVNAFAPVVAAPPVVVSGSSFPSHHRGMHAVRRSLSITCEPDDGSDTYARSAAPHDLAIRMGRVNHARLRSSSDMLGLDLVPDVVTCGGSLRHASLRRSIT